MKSITPIEHIPAVIHHDGVGDPAIWCADLESLWPEAAGDLEGLVIVADGRRLGTTETLAGTSGPASFP